MGEHDATAGDHLVVTIERQNGEKVSFNFGEVRRIADDFEINIEHHIRRVMRSYYEEAEPTGLSTLDLRIRLTGKVTVEDAKAGGEGRELSAPRKRIGRNA